MNDQTMGGRMVDLAEVGTCGVNHGSGRSSGKTRADEALVQLFEFIHSK